MALKVELEPKTASLLVGGDYARENTITCTIQLNGNEPVWLTLEIPVGENGVLRQFEDANDIVIETPGTDPQPRPVEDMKWSLGNVHHGVQVSGATELTLSISNLLCRAREGDSQIKITAETENATDSTTLTIKKVKPEDPILYFKAEPTCLFGSGAVTLEWEVVGDVPATLETPAGPQTTLASPYIDDDLAQTWAYSLKVGNHQRQVTVDVFPAGWNESHSLPEPDSDAFPSVIFDSAHGTDSTAAAALYAIFVCGPERRAVLYKSANGVTDWEKVCDNVPDGMESSPGVRLRNRLWLIGGSAVDPERISNRICYYDLDLGNGWQEADVTGFDAGARMGHACTVVDDNTVWVLGGLDKYRTSLNDGWILTFSDGGETVNAKPLEKESDWPPRCMFSAARFGDMIWVCGGVTSPNGRPLGDLWATDSGNLLWNERPTGETGLVVTNAVGIGAVAADDKLFVLMMNRTGGPDWQLDSGMWAIGTSGMGETSDTWVRTSRQPDFLNHLPPKPHSIAVVCFQNRLYLRHLHGNDLCGDFVRSPMYVYVQS